MQYLFVTTKVIKKSIDLSENTLALFFRESAFSLSFAFVKVMLNVFGGHAWENFQISLHLLNRAIHQALPSAQLLEQVKTAL